MANFHHVNALDPIFRHEIFDYARAQDIATNIADPLGFRRTIRHVLRPGGCLAI